MKFGAYQVESYEKWYLAHSFWKARSPAPLRRPGFCSALDQLRRVNLGSIYFFSFATAAESFLTLAIRDLTCEASAVTAASASDAACVAF